jgi:hypothetical protein
VLTAAPAALERAAASTSIACGIGAGLCFIFTDEPVVAVATAPRPVAAEGSASPWGGGNAGFWHTL